LVEGTPARINAVRRIMEAGYNSNYAGSWYLCRTALKLEPNAGGDLVVAGTDSTGDGVNDFADAKGLGGTVGPLTVAVVTASRIPSSNIPLLGCAGPGDASEAVLTTTIPGFNQAGERLVEAMNDGPGFWAGTKISLIKGTNAVVVPGTTSSSNPAFDGDDLPTSNNIAASSTGMGDGGNGTHGGPDGFLWLQDTRDWLAVHGGGNRSTLNLLMADGSVKSVADINGDAYLNPGFPIDPAQADQNDGYLDNLVELEPFVVYSGPNISKTSSVKGNFE
jgi:prepilin-type processing-associated H-X9-DG protein